MKLLIKTILLAFCLITATAFAVEGFYPFEKTEDQQRFMALTTELRCLVCQNQNIAESNAPLANDLRNQIYQKIQNGESNEAILRYLVERYGDFILYQPPFNVKTLGLWLGPFILLLGGLVILFKGVGRAKRFSRARQKILI